jgi:uncharacterized protein
VFLVTGNVPVATPETAPFWEGVSLGSLRLPRCQECTRWFFPPSPVCPTCTSREVKWFAASGRGTLYSYVIAYRPLPEWQSTSPMSVALVELQEGPRLVSTVVDCEQTPQALVIDMPLVATFRDFGGHFKMLCFAPAPRSVDS